MIWKRFVASRMSSAVYETVNVKIAAGDYRFTVAAFQASPLTDLCLVYTASDEEKDDKKLSAHGLHEDTRIGIFVL